MRVGSGPYTVPISIAGASRLSTLTISITFNPALVRVRNVQEGTFMRQGGVTSAFTPRIDAANGRVDIAIARQELDVLARSLKLTRATRYVSLVELSGIAVRDRERGDDGTRRHTGGGFELEPWDWAYYSEKLRRAEYAYDESQLRPYFELDAVIERGVFFAAHELYGITLTERADLPTYHPDVRVFEVHDADGELLAIFLGDYYARPSKRGGAWASSYVSQSHLFGEKPVVANHLNIPKPVAATGAPASTPPAARSSRLKCMTFSASRPFIPRSESIPWPASGPAARRR